MFKSLSMMAVALAALGVLMQDEDFTPPGPAPEDVASPDALLAAVYDVISGGLGEARDWDRFRSLFTPDGRMAAVVSKAGDDPASLLTMTPEDYIERAGPSLLDGGFYEVEVARTTERFGNVLHAFSTYEGRRTLEDEEPFLSGVNSFQLVSDGTTWRVHSILWEAEHAELQIPERYRESR